MRVHYTHTHIVLSPLPSHTKLNQPTTAMEANTDAVVLGERRMSTMTSGQAEAVERWLDGQQPPVTRGQREGAVAGARKPDKSAWSNTSNSSSSNRHPGRLLHVRYAPWRPIHEPVQRHLRLQRGHERPGQGHQPPWHQHARRGLNWILSVPVVCLLCLPVDLRESVMEKKTEANARQAGIAFLWEMSRFVLRWRRRREWQRRDQLLEAVVEALLGVISAICAILAAFQAAQHRSFNARTAAADGRRYHDVGLEIALAVLLGFPDVSSAVLFRLTGCVLTPPDRISRLRIKAVCLIEANRKKAMALPRGRQTLVVATAV